MEPLKPLLEGSQKVFGDLETFLSTYDPDTNLLKKVRVKAEDTPKGKPTKLTQYPSPLKEEADQVGPFTDWLLANFETELKTNDVRSIITKMSKIPERDRFDLAGLGWKTQHWWRPSFLYAFF